MTTKPGWPVLLTVDEAAELLRTTRKAITRWLSASKSQASRGLDGELFQTDYATGCAKSPRHRRRSKRR